jgi:hypothetical protein
MFCLVSLWTELASFLQLYVNIETHQQLSPCDTQISLQKIFFPRVRRLFRTNDSMLMKRNGSATQHSVRMAVRTVFTVCFIKYAVISYVATVSCKHNRRRQCVSTVLTVQFVPHRKHTPSSYCKSIPVTGRGGI